MRRTHNMVPVVLLLGFGLASCSSPRPHEIVVSLRPQPGPGKIVTHWGGYGPSSDPMGGQVDLSDEVVRGVPDSLSDLNVRFIDFQWQLLLLDAFENGRVDTVEYEQYRDPTLHVTLPDQAFDQHLHYAVGRKSTGDYLIVFDTDNDEDLSDETAAVFHWEGPPINIMTYFAQAQSTADYLRQVGSVPRAEVTVQLFDGEQIHDAEVILAIAPHLEVVIPAGIGGDTLHIPSYMIGAYQNMVGVTDIAGKEYTFWVGSPRLGQYLRRDAEVWFEEGDLREAQIDSAAPFAANPFLVGQVVQLGDQFYRLDDVAIDGSKLRLVEVEDMPGVGIRPGQDAPQFRAATIDGDGISLSDYRGKYVLLDFWATSCGPCLADLPETRNVYAAFGRDDFEIIGIAEDDPTWLSRFVDDNGIAWPQVTQDRDDAARRSILEDYRVTGIPAYFLIDPEGKVVDPSLGVRPPELAQTLETLIANR